ncbi:MAG TPA: segregation/condensation protein A [Candidatus Omnitrophota bacterium]|nr:segregation/condensation protein A [Candidatus Omnitrophota bacterium]HQL41174.1 segregation/condensation protein A [Candidatus Omnitrophota bacterium]
MNYKIKLEVFEGPLDLLLYLIKKDELNIYDIPISQITDQYMEYLDMMKLLDLDVVGDFLVMAATLMQIKSKMLLPPDPSEQATEEIDPRDELVQRLLEYKKFKEAAEDLRQKELTRQDFFNRKIDEEKIKALKEDATEVYFEASLFDLISAFANALKNVPKDVFYEVIKEEFTVEQKIHDILHLFLHQNTVVLTELFMKARSKDEVIVTFMAILELIRLREVVAVQKGIFGEIEVVRNKENLELSHNDQEPEGPGSQPQPEEPASDDVDSQEATGPAS